MIVPPTLTLIMLGPSAAVRDAAIGAVLPINLHDSEYCPTPARRLMQLRCIAIEPRPRASPLAGTNPYLTSTPDGPLPLSP